MYPQNTPSLSSLHTKYQKRQAYFEGFNAHFCSFKLQCFEVFVTSFTFFVDMNAVPNSVTLDSWDTLHKIYELENRDLIQVKPIHILSCKTRLCTAGLYKTQLNHEGVFSLFRALVKGFTWTPSSEKSLGLTVSLSRHSSNTACPRQKWRPNKNWVVCLNKQTSPRMSCS